MKKNYSIFILTCFLFFGGNAFGQTTYTLITSTSELVAGDKYLIVTENTAGSRFAAGYLNTDHRPLVSVTVSAGLTISATPATNNSQTTNVFEFTLGGSSGAWTLYDAANSGYLIPATGSNSNNHLKTQVGSSTWTISFSSGAAVMTNIGHPNTNGRNIIRYNSGSPRISCYASGQNAVYLFRAPSATNYFWNGGNGTNNTNNIWDLNTTRNWGITTGATFAANTTPGVVWPTSGSYVANFANTVAAAKTINMPAAISVMPSNTIIGTTDYIFVPSVTQTFSSPVKLDQTLTVAPATGTTFTMSGVLSGAGGLTQNGAGITLLSGISTHTGTTTVTSGTIRLGAAGTSPNTPLGTTAAGTTVSSGGVLDLNGFTLATAESLTLNGTGISSGGALINSTSTAATYTGAVALASNSSIGTATTGHISIQGAVSGAFTLTKVGAGILNLMGTQSYNGVTVSAGQLQLNPSASFTAAGTCNFNGGTLATSSITSGRTITFGTIDVSAASTLALQSAIDHTITFTSAGTLSAMLTITGWTGNYTLGTTGAVTNAGKIFIGNSASLSAAQLAQIRFYNGTNYYPATQLSTGQIVPTTKLVITTIGNQTEGVGFSVTITATDFDGNPVNLTNATGINLTSSTNTIGGTTIGTINAGSSSVTISGVTLSAGTNATITATRSSGDQPIPTTSNTFDVVTPSTPILSAGALTGFGSSVCVGTTAGPNSFTLSGASLDGTDVSVSGNAVYTFATTSGGSYSNPLTLTAYNGTSPSSIFVQFSPSAATNYDGNITISGGGATSVTTAVTGSGINGTPAVTTVAATGITANSASSGGNSVSTTCGTISAKGVVWALTANPTIVSNLGITSDGTGTANYTSSIGSLSANTLYNYRAYVTNSNGITTYGSNLTFTTLKAEPTNYPTAFTCGTPTTTTIPLTWTDASTGALPDGYLIKWSSVSYAAITDPVDGTAIANGAGVQNIAQGVGTFTPTLIAGTTYFFKIWSYSNSGTNINYKLTGEPQTSCTTVSASSDIILSGMTYTSDIAYTSFQAPASLTNTSGNVGVMGITIRDGGTSSPDNDGLPTILTGITFSGITGTSMIRTAALFEGNALITGANAPTINVGANTIAFSGLSYSCSDNFTRDLTLRVSFLTTVTDNLQMTFSVTNANVTTASSATSSQMSAFTTVPSSTTGDRNRIEVTADRIRFTTQPIDQTVSVNLVTFTIKAVDVNNNMDADASKSIDLTTSGTGMTSATPYTLSAGVLNISNVQFGSAQGPITLTATTSGYTDNDDVSDPFTISNTATGSYRTTSNCLWSSTGANNTGTWQVYSGGWQNLPYGGYTNPYPPTNTTTAIIYIHHTVTLQGNNTVKNIIIENGGTLNTSTVQPGFKNLLIKNGGVFNKNPGNGLIFDSDGILEVEDGGTFNYSHTNSTSRTTNLWNGTERFHPNSNFVVKETDNTSPGNLVMETTTEVSLFNGALFGNFIIDMASAGGQVPLFASGLNTKLTNGDFICRTGSNSGMIFNSGNYTVTIGGDLIIESTYNQPFTLTNSASTVNFTVNGNVIHNGTAEFRLANSQTTNNPSVTLNIDSNLVIGTSNFNFDIGSTSTGTNKSTVNLKGDLTVGSGNILTTNSTAAKKGEFNFTGTYNSSDTNTIQKVDVASTGATTENARVNFNIKSGTYTQLISKDFELGTNSKLTVEGDAIFDFGFNTSTPLNVVISGSQTGTAFESLDRSILKITNLQGISTTGSIGNVQVVASNRNFSQIATFWYIGKDNQVTGNGITTASTAKVIICDMIDNTKTLTPTNNTAVSSTTTVDATYGGHLYIKKGQLTETTSAYFTSGSGTLRMEPGTLYYISKGNSSFSASNSDFIPRMAGSLANTYYLTGGTIEFAGGGSSHGFQTLRGARTYNRLKFSGVNGINTDYKNLSSNAVVDSSVEISFSIVDCVDGSLNPVSFTGDGGLIMNNANGVLKIKNTSNVQPELDGNNVDYSLTGGTVEFYGTSATQQQQLRGNYKTAPATPVKINYYNIQIRADAANLPTFSSTPTSTQLGSVGNVDVNSSFLLTNILTVNSPAVLRMDQNDFIDNGTGTSQVITILSGAGLLYANQNGIKTSGTGVNDGNIRTSGTRTFSTSANYGFVSSGDMVSGNGLPATVAGLYIYKTFKANKVTLNNGGTLVNGILGLQKGTLVSSDPQKITLAVVATSDIKSPANVGGVQDMGYDSSYVQGKMGHNSASTSEIIFPIGSAAKYGPFALTPQSTTSQTYNGEYTSSGYGTYTLDPANSPQLDHVSLVEYWNINSSLTPSPPFTYDDAKIKLFWRAHSTVGPSASEWSQLRVAHFDGADWNTEGNSPTFHASPSTSWGWLESDIYCANFSPFTIGTLTPLNPLPVELTSFTGSCNDGSVQINWSTASELNSSVFLVQRSENGVNYTTVATIPASGNSNQPRNYSITDNTDNNNSYYRLIEVDTDGKQTIYSFIQVRCSEVNGVHVFYNQPKVVVEVNSNTDKQVGFNVYEVSGKLLHKEVKQIVRGYNRFDLSIQDKLAKGIYIIQMIDGEKATSTKVMVH